MRHSSYLEVNLDLLGQNFQKIQTLAPASELLPMVKANAYGNGLVPVSRFLVEECQAKKLGCASLGEALRIFEECPGLNAEVLVFSDTELNNEKCRQAYVDHNITPVIHRRSDLEVVLNSNDFKNVPLVLKINSGMNRLGLTLEDIGDMAPRLRARGVDHLLSHFAYSYFPLKAGDRTHRQNDEFLKAKKILIDAQVEIRATSLSNSGAIEQGFGVNETFVRPGLMLYGPYSVEPRIWDGHQVSRLVTKALKTFMVKKGSPVGYGTHVAGEDHFIVVIPMGYGDGILTYASGTELTIKGYKGRIFARVNMDMSFIAFDPSVAGKIKEDESLEIWNHDNRVISDIATQMKTIPYQIMCGISGRIPRIYKVK